MSDTAFDPRMMSKPGIRAGAIAVLSALTLAAPATAGAAASATTPPASQPAAFVLSAVGSSGPVRLLGAPGATLHSAVLVRNVTSHDVTVLLSAADIQTASTGNAVYVTSAPSRTGAWLRLGATTVALAAHAIREIPYTATVPANASGGAHYAGIVATDAADYSAAAAPKVKGVGFAFRLVVRQALPLTIRLPGALTRSLALRSIQLTPSTGGAGLVLALLPGGTELIEGARVNLRVLRGARTLFTTSSTLGQLFPGSGLGYRVPWQGQPTPGRYRVTGVIRPQDAAPIYINQTVAFTVAKAAQQKLETAPVPQHTRTVTSVPPWVWALLALVVLLVAALAAMLIALRRTKRADDPPTPHPDAEPTFTDDQPEPPSDEGDFAGAGRPPARRR